MTRATVTADAKPIGNQLGEGAGILVGNYARDRPGHGSMLGGKRRTPGKEMARAAAIVRPLPLKHGLQREVDRGRVHGGFDCQESGFGGVVVVRDFSEKEHSARSARQRENAVIRDAAAARDLARRNLFREPGIARHECSIPASAGSAQIASRLSQMRKGLVQIDF